MRIFFPQPDIPPISKISPKFPIFFLQNHFFKITASRCFLDSLLPRTPPSPVPGTAGISRGLVGSGCSSNASPVHCCAVHCRPLAVHGCAVLEIGLVQTGVVLSVTITSRLENFSMKNNVKCLNGSIEIDPE